jgi:hypothetical protein
MTTIHLVLRNVHIAAGVLTLVSGFAAMLLKKGSPLHRRAGNAFFVAMVLLGPLGVALSLLKTPNMGNIMGGTTAFNLVVTAWATVIRPAGRIGGFEIAAALFGFAVAAGATTFGVLAMLDPKGVYHAYPPMMYFIFASVLWIAVGMDARMIVRRGVSGVARTSRHLTRMSLAFFMATGSFFFGQPGFLSPVIRDTALRPILGLFPLALLIFWLIRVRLWPRQKGESGARSDELLARASPSPSRLSPLV